MNVRQFVSKNLVLIIMVPVIIGSHYGWLKLQQNEDLVSAEDRKKLPFLGEKWFRGDQTKQ